MNLLRPALFGLFLTSCFTCAGAGNTPRLPNIVLIFCDDMGYADVGCYGAKGYKTPHIDRLGRDGVRFTDFYVPQAVCSASRIALLTGCYPNRVGILGALGPNAKVGIHSNELTLAEMLKARSYATAIYGKWHAFRDTRSLNLREILQETTISTRPRLATCRLPRPAAPPD